LQGGEESSITATLSSTACSETSAEPETHEASGDDISDNSTEGDSRQANCNIDNDLVDDLPTTSANSGNDTSRLDSSIAVQCWFF